MQGPKLHRFGYALVDWQPGSATPAIERQQAVLRWAGLAQLPLSVKNVPFRVTVAPDVIGVAWRDATPATQRRERSSFFTLVAMQVLCQMND